MTYPYPAFTPHLHEHQLPDRLYECLDLCLADPKKLPYKESHQYKPLHFIADDLDSGNERKVVFELCRLLKKSLKIERPAACAERKTAKGDDRPDLISQIATLYPTGVEGKRPYHDIMSDTNLVLRNDFRDRLVEALGNPNSSSGRMHWPNMEQDQLKDYIKILKLIADFDYKLGKDSPTANMLYKGNHDPALAHLPLIERNQRYHSVKKIQTLDKPAVIYFGGMTQPSEEPEYVNRAFRRIKRTIDPSIVPPSDYDIYVMTYNNGASLRKTQYVLETREAPDDYASANAKAAVNIYLMPHISTVNEEGETTRLPQKELEKNLSLLTFCGYSYGTNFIQEVRNAMRHKMHELGYSGQEIADGLACVAAVNLGPLVHVKDHQGRGNFTQLYAASAGDESTDVKSNIPQLTANDPAMHVKRHIVGDEDRPQALVLRGMDTEQQLYSVPLEKITYIDPADEGEQPNKIKQHVIDGAKNVRGIYTDKLKLSIQDNHGRHHIEDKMRATFVRSDDDTLTIANNLAAYGVRHFMQRSMKAALDVASGKEEKRDSAGILAKVNREDLSPHAVFDYHMLATRTRESYQALLNNERIERTQRERH